MGCRSWLIVAASVLLLTLILPPNLSADIVNGTFDAGRSVTGFSSGYTFEMGQVHPGDFTVDSDPGRDGHNDSWDNFYDHTTGTAAGMMMIVNGSTTSGRTVWQGYNDSLLDPGTYTFSAWVKSAVSFNSTTCTNCAATLVFSVEGGPSWNFTAPGSGWQQFQGAFDLATAGNPYFRIVDTNTGDGYNDFVLDDIHLQQATVPDGGMTLILLGGALFAIESLRRKSRV